MYDIIIIGGGAAGLNAALYASRQGMKTAVISKDFGGTTMEAHLIENWLGFEGTGTELAEKFVEHSKKFGAEHITAEIKKVEKQGNKFIVSIEGKKYESKSLILATGMEHRKLGIKGEKEFFGKGVSYCYTCDGPLFKGKTVAVIGGADSAVNGAWFMSDYAKKVYIIYRKDKLRAEPVTVDRVLKTKNIEPVYNANVTEIKGDKMVSSVLLDTGKELEVEGIFIEIGHVPLTAIVKDLGIELNNKGFVKSDDWRATNVPGVFVAGDLCANNVIRQVVSAVADGATAAISAAKYVKSGKND